MRGFLQTAHKGGDRRSTALDYTSIQIRVRFPTPPHERKNASEVSTLWQNVRAISRRGASRWTLIHMCMHGRRCRSCFWLKRPYRLTVRTSDSQSENMGSNPVRVTSPASPTGRDGSLNLFRIAP